MALRSVAVTKDPGASPFNVNMPAGYAAGDRLVAFIACDGNPSNFTPATGWTLVSTKQEYGTDTQTFAVYEIRNATGSEAVNWATNAQLALVVVICAFTGRDTSAALDFATAAVNTGGGASPNTLTGNSGTASSEADLVWGGCVDQASSGAWTYTPPSDGGTWTEIADETNATGWVSLGVAVLANVSSGAKGTISGTATRASNSTGGWAQFVLSIPSDGSGGASVSDITASPAARIARNTLLRM